eukprot:357263-Chlamydomonas_euryale.AAC.2
MQMRLSTLFNNASFFMLMPYIGIRCGSVDLQDPALAASRVSRTSRTSNTFRASRTLRLQPVWAASACDRPSLAFAPPPPPLPAPLVCCSSPLRVPRPVTHSWCHGQSHACLTCTRGLPAAYSRPTGATIWPRALQSCTAQGRTMLPRQAGWLTPGFSHCTRHACSGRPDRREHVVTPTCACMAIGEPQHDASASMVWHAHAVPDPCKRLLNLARACRPCSMQGHRLHALAHFPSASRRSSQSLSQTPSPSSFPGLHGTCVRGVFDVWD